MPHTQQFLEAQAVTSGKHHFFGYYDKTPWDATGQYILSLESSFLDRQPTADDTVVIGMVDLHDNNRWIPLAETHAWCWQQSTMLQWLPNEPDRKIIYNQRDGDRFVSIIQDVFTGEKRVLPRPIYAVNGSQALSLNFARLNRTRPGYGYMGVQDSGENDPHPTDDGIYWLDLDSGENHLIISYDDARNFHPVDTMNSGQHWFNHIHIAPDGSNFIWLHRWQHPLNPNRQWVDRLLTANMDGSGKCVVADDYFVSHLDYYTPDRVIAWSRQKDVGDRYFLFTRCSDDVEIVGDGLFSTDGHCNFSPDRRWMLTDTYPNEDNLRTLILYHVESKTRIDIGQYFAPPELTGAVRCDLHPRWSRDGRHVCIDSAHESERQIYIIDVLPVIDDYA